MNGKDFEILRKRYGIKRSQFSRWAGYSESMVFKWERNPKHSPSEKGIRLLLSYIKTFKAGNSPASSNNSQSKGVQP